MNRKLIRAALFAAAAVAVVVSSGVLTADDKADKVPSIEEIMKKGHAGGKSLMKGIGNDIKAEKWDDADTKAKALAVFGEALGKNKPEKGDAATWKPLADKYKANTAAVAAAVEKKDAAASTAALGVIGKSCKECHDAHKE